MRPPSFPAPGGPTRRAILAVAAGSAVTGCTVGPDPGRSDAGDPAAPSRMTELEPDVALAVDALVAEQAVLAAVEATLERHRRLRGTLSPMLGAHRAHVSLLARAAPGGSESPSPSTAGDSGESSAPFRVRSNGPAALRGLCEMELGLSTATKRRSFAAESGAFARLLASMAAASAQHWALLVEASRSTDSRKSRGS